jgi:hypothetical protein
MQSDINLPQKYISNGALGTCVLLYICRKNTSIMVLLELHFFLYNVCELSKRTYNGPNKHINKNNAKKIRIMWTSMEVQIITRKQFLPIIEQRDFMLCTKNDNMEA